MSGTPRASDHGEYHVPDGRSLRQALGDPGSFTPRGDNYAEEIIDWQARAVLIALRGLPIDERAAVVGMRRVESKFGFDDLFEEVTEDANDPQPPPVIEGGIYFGCIGQAGHHFHLPNGRSPRYNKPTEVVPWGYGVERLTPMESRSQGDAALHHLDGWTALAIHDYTVDSRGNSKAVFCFPADLTADEVLYQAGYSFSELAARVGTVRLVATCPDGATCTCHTSEERRRGR